jgi:hypothetical protein
LEINVAQLARPMNKNLQIIQDFSTPWIVEPLLKTPDVPPPNETVHPVMAITAE